MDHAGRLGSGRPGAAVAALALVLLALALPAIVPTGAGAEVAGTLPGVAFYPRVVQLAHAGADSGTLLATTNDGAAGTIWRSDDDGATFTELATIDPGADAAGLCCIELFELPTATGGAPAGTLLWSGSVTKGVGPPRAMSLRTWRSDDHGASWVPIAPCTTSVAGGLWEPSFHIADDGRLVCTWSDESDQPAHSQVLRMATSDDAGATWGAPTDVVAHPASWLRPGMATTVRLPDGTWVMTYEVCGASPSCGIWLRRSEDGLDWGDPAELGERVTTPDGGYLAHTPVLRWTPAGGGTLLLSGQILFDADGTVADGNGRTLLVAQGDGSGPWRRAPAPVPVADPFDHWCPNYSSPVIDLDGTGRLLGLASSWDGERCTTSWGTARIDLDPPVTSTSSPPTTAAPSPTTDPAGGATPVPATPTFTG